MKKNEFIEFTALINYLKELGINPAEYLSREELKRYTEFGAAYVGMPGETFRDELKAVIMGMAERHLR
ncbi:hypothetical protein [Paenibacillus sp. YPG26]|uniref:hypothetical protein n=1 Tax=Paenibacillus sp. YPG26 TaxID=2878915 RepID=UPI00203D0FD1|nr:hypothetical protein [Paenibacillus sp. YPG26]USB33369.1 hypothetical protein LDO05_00545 [Paenibacillus sp. YPG26]